MSWLYSGRRCAASRCRDLVLVVILLVRTVISVHLFISEAVVLRGGWWARRDTRGVRGGGGWLRGSLNHYVLTLGGPGNSSFLSRVLWCGGRVYCATVLCCFVACVGLGVGVGGS